MDSFTDKVLAFGTWPMTITEGRGWRVTLLVLPLFILWCIVLAPVLIPLLFIGLIYEFLRDHARGGW